MSVPMATYVCSCAQTVPSLPVLTLEVLPHADYSCSPSNLPHATPGAACRSLLFAQRSAVVKDLHLLVLWQMSRLRT